MVLWPAGPGYTPSAEMCIEPMGPNIWLQGPLAQQEEQQDACLMSILAAHSDSLSIQTCVDLVCMSACLDGTWPALLLNVPTRLFLSLSLSLNPETLTMCRELRILWILHGGIDHNTVQSSNRQWLMTQIYPNRPLLWGHSQAVPQGESAAACTAGAQVNIRKPHKLLLVLRSQIPLWGQRLQSLHESHGFCGCNV